LSQASAATRSPWIIPEAPLSGSGDPTSLNPDGDPEGDAKAAMDDSTLRSMASD